MINLKGFDMDTNEHKRQQLLADGYIKVGSKSYCEYWKKDDHIHTLYNDDEDCQRLHKDILRKAEVSQLGYKEGSMTSSIDTVRDKRLMVFTSLLRTLNFVDHARVDQCYGLFVEFEEQHPLIDGYTRNGKAVDHTNMKMFIKLYKEI